MSSHQSFIGVDLVLDFDFDLVLERFSLRHPPYVVASQERQRPDSRCGQGWRGIPAIVDTTPLFFKVRRHGMEWNGMDGGSTSSPYTYSLNESHSHS